MFERANPVKELDAIAMACPYRIRVSWDRITHVDFEGVEIIWWCLGEPVTERSRLIRYYSQFFIDAKSAKTYVVAIRAHYMEGFYLPSPWVHAIVEVPWAEDKPQYTDLGQVTVMDTPRGPAILLDDLRDAFS